MRQLAAGHAFALTQHEEDAKLPSITFEIETADAAPYEWTWSLSWSANVSGLKESAQRGKVLKTFTKTATFFSDAKSWPVDLTQVIGGTLTVKVKTAKDAFKRSIYILGKNPGEVQIQAGNRQEVSVQAKTYLHYRHPNSTCRQPRTSNQA